MTVAVVTQEQQRTMPWRNGGGVTRELLVEPPGATFDTGFIYRLSIADIEKDGPFSELPGIDRSMVVIEGAGLELEFPMGRREEVAPYGVFRFPGEVPCTGHLKSGPVRDVNAMTARLKARHAAKVVDVDNQPRPLLATSLKAAAPVVGILATDRPLKVRVDGRDHAVPIGAALLARGVFAFTLAAEARTKAVVIEFAQR